MAKQKDEQVQQVEVTPVADVNPQVAFAAAWQKDQSIRAVLTKRAEVRGNLRPSEKAKAEQIKASFGL